MPAQVQVQIPSHETSAAGVVYYSVLASKGEASSSQKKRYNDFIQLNNELATRKLPMLRLPGKLWFHFDSNLRERRCDLERALRNYLERRGTNPVLEEFLGVDKRTGTPRSASPQRARGGGNEQLLQQQQQEEEQVAPSSSVQVQTPGKNADSSYLVPVQQQQQGAISSLITRSKKLQQDPAIVRVLAVLVLLLAANWARKKTNAFVGFCFLLTGSAGLAALTRTRAAS